MPRFGSSPKTDAPASGPPATVDTTPGAAPLRVAQRPNHGIDPEPKKKARSKPKATVKPAQITKAITEVLDEGGSWDELALTEDGRHVYSGSKLAECPTSLVSWVLRPEEAADMPDMLRQALDEGITNEPIILQMFMEQHGYRRATFPELAKLREKDVIAGYNPVMQQVQVRCDVGSTAQIRCHVDDIVTHSTLDINREDNPYYIVEAKALGPSLWQQWKKNRDLTVFFKGKYAWQVTGQMMCTGLTLFFVVGRKDDKGVVQEIDVEMFEAPPLPAGTVKAKVLKAEKHVKLEQVPMCEEGQWPCAWFKTPEHPESDKDPKAKEDLDDLDLGSLCARFVAYKKDARDADKMASEMKAQIDKHFRDAGYAEGTVFNLRDEAGNKFEFEWVRTPVEAKTVAAYEMSYPRVKLLD